MRLCKNPQKRRIVIQNGRQDEVAVITYATESFEHAVAVKKEAWQKSIAASQP